MATGWPMKTTYADGDVYAASDVNDITGTINLLGQSVAVTAGKNKILNSAAQIWQRGTTVTASGAYTADRFAEVSGNSIVYTRSTDVPSSLGFQYSISRAGTGSNMIQRIESFNAAQLAGQTVTLSFYYKSTAGTDSFVTLFYYANAADNFGAVTQIGSTQTIATPATSWTRVSYTFTNISANAINGLQVNFARGNTATSTTLITGIQLEVGSTATAFQTATGTIQGELAACQRYYWRTNATNTFSAHGQGGFVTTTAVNIYLVHPVPMRISPSSLDFSNVTVYTLTDVNFAVSAMTLSGAVSSGLISRIQAGVTGGTAGTGAILTNNNNTAGYVGLSAEL